MTALIGDDDMKSAISAGKVHLKNALADDAQRKVLIVLEDSLAQAQPNLSHQIARAILKIQKRVFVGTNNVQQNQCLTSFDGKGSFK